MIGWMPTKDLRFVVRPGSAPSRILQQRWINLLIDENAIGGLAQSAEEWRDVPCIDETVEDAQT